MSNDTSTLEIARLVDRVAAAQAFPVRALVALGETAKALTSERDALRARVAVLEAALRFYSLPEHWMTLGEDGPRVVWVARTHLDTGPDGYSTARAALDPPAKGDGT